MDQTRVSYYFGRLLEEGLGLDYKSDPNLCDTPDRVAKMYCKELFKSVGEEFSDFKSFPNEDKVDEIILSDLIHFTSVCSHHFLPFTGHAWLAYIPTGLLVGASKPARLVEHYAARPQLQERLCHQVIEAFNKAMKPKGCMVVMRGVHGCMKCRGVRQSNGAGMITSATRGVFKEDLKAKEEVLTLITLSLLHKLE